jgi:segregation and condensation protein B
MSGGYLFRTHHAYSTWVQQLIQGRPVRLSRAQLETLSIVAYRQPITRPEIDQIRGVDSGATLKLLLDRHLIRILGKKEEPGRPMLYGTTKEFLDFFSLKDLRELPTLREYSELSEESRQVVARAQHAIDAAAAAADALDTGT